MSLTDLSRALRGVKDDTDDVDKAITRVRVRVDDELPAMRTAVSQYLTFMLRAATQADEALDSTTEHANMTIAQMAVAYGEAQKLAQQIDAEFAALLATITDKSADLFDFNGMRLEEFVANQRDLIEQIEGTAFGAHLELFAKAYIAIQNGQDTTGQFYKQLEASEKMIRWLTGPAGQKFDFFRFKEDLDAALKRMKEDLAGTIMQQQSSPYSSGTLGKPNAHPCGAGQPSLNILALTGALRWR